MGRAGMTGNKGSISIVGVVSAMRGPIVGWRLKMGFRLWPDMSVVGE